MLLSGFCPGRRVRDHARRLSFPPGRRGHESAMAANTAVVWHGISTVPGAWGTELSEGWGEQGTHGGRGFRINGPRVPWVVTSVGHRTTKTGQSAFHDTFVGDLHSRPGPVDASYHRGAQTSGLRKSARRPGLDFPTLHGPEQRHGQPRGGLHTHGHPLISRGHRTLDRIGTLFLTKASSPPV